MDQAGQGDVHQAKEKLRRVTECWNYRQQD
jgi:hypothetical protein